MTTYKDAGVDPICADEILKSIDNIGGFGAVIPIDHNDMKRKFGNERKLVMGTDTGRPFSID